MSGEARLSERMISFVHDVNKQMTEKRLNHAKHIHDPETRAWAESLKNQAYELMQEADAIRSDFSEKGVKTIEKEEEGKEIAINRDFVSMVASRIEELLR